MVAAALPIPTDVIADICRKYGIARLDIFGSALRDDFDPARSDVDLLVGFLPGRQVGFFELADAEAELSRAFGGRPIDLVPRDSINRWIRKRVLSEARPTYVLQG